jgi:hypothetical protein
MDGSRHPRQRYAIHCSLAREMIAPTPRPILGGYADPIGSARPRADNVK